MLVFRFLAGPAALCLLSAPAALAQSDTPATPAAQGKGNRPPEIPLVVPTGTALRISLSQRVRIGRSGEEVTGLVAGTVYAFDQAVIPAGTPIHGKVIRVDAVPRKKRLLAGLNGDFSPAKKYQVVFDSLVLPGGKKLEIQTAPAEKAIEPVALFSDRARARKKSRAAQAASQAKQDVSQRAHEAFSELKSPGKMQRLKRYLVAQLPYRRQFIEPGERFMAVLQSPVPFGTVSHKPEELSALGGVPPIGSTLHARLEQELSSATAQRGTPVEAVVTVPVYSAEGKLILPAESRLVGEVVVAKPARSFHRNGDLRFNFTRISLPGGTPQVVRGAVEGMEADGAAGLKLDSEGGVHATESKSRYLMTGLAIGMAAIAARPDVERGATDTTGDPAVRTGSGIAGARLVGAAVGFASRSRIFAAGLGAYGAALSVYSHFLSRGKDVVLAKNKPLEIGFGRSPANHAKTKTKP
jgi:hypothetical protein